MEFGPVVTTVVGVRAGDEMRLRYAWLRGEREFLAVEAQGDLVLDLEGPGPDTLGLNQGDRTSLTWVESVGSIRSTRDWRKGRDERVRSGLIFIIRI